MQRTEAKFSAMRARMSPTRDATSAQMRMPSSLVRPKYASTAQSLTKVDSRSWMSAGSTDTHCGRRRGRMRGQASGVSA